ncbi:MAG: EAL domain-containing protein [Eubacterium sp.]|nr:EAL domain-containing protein [Eubacterium sp.]
MNYSFNLGVAVSSLLICIVNLIYTFIMGRTDKVQNKLFICILCILSINSITGIASAVIGLYPDRVADPEYASEVSRYAYFVTHTALCPVFYYYVSRISLVSTRLGNWKVALLSLPFFVTELMALINPLTHWVWSRELNLEFRREWGEILIYIAAALYYVMALIVFTRSWTYIAGKRKVAIVFSFVLVAAGVFVQLLDKNLKVEVLAESIGFTGAMMAVENEDDRIDFGTMFYNRIALSYDVGGCMKHHRKLSVIVLRINNYEVINRLAGNEETNVLSDILSGFLTSLVKRYYVYVPNDSTFVMTLYDKPGKEVDQLVDKLSARMEEPWEYQDFSIQISSTILVTQMPEQIREVSELFYMIDSPVPQKELKPVMKEHDLDYIMRRQAVEKAIIRGFTDNSFEVYFQPTYHIDGRIHGAEALTRMNDKELGRIFPDEFIPVAEQTGMIDDLDDYVLEEVCKFIRSGIPQKYGIVNINVNLSVLQCMKPGFIRNINRIVEQYGIKKRSINFEITESIAADDYRILSKVIKQLKDDGYLFSMDDYGTGYSNVSAIFSLNLDVIKIDKSILWGAEKSKLGMIVLENTIRMIRQMGKKILVEGVETKEQIELLRKLGVDYLQGFYFSKPIPKDEFIQLIEKDARIHRV